MYRDDIPAPVQVDPRVMRESDTCSSAQASGPNEKYRTPSMRETAEKAVGHHREQAEKCDRAAAFFRENPAFDEFIQLVRSGIIQF